VSRFFLLLSVLMVLAGCGEPTASVSGTVKFKDQPLPSGTVLFHGPDGRVEHAVIGEGGKYALANAPLGPVRIAVKSHAAQPTGMPGAGKPPPGAKDHAPAQGEKRDGRYVPIPPRYADPETSGLSHTVRTGSQTHDIDLRP